MLYVPENHPSAEHDSAGFITLAKARSRHRWVLLEPEALSHPVMPGERPREAAPGEDSQEAVSAPRKHGAAAGRNLRGPWVPWDSGVGTPGCLHELLGTVFPPPLIESL